MFFLSIFYHTGKGLPMTEVSSILHFLIEMTFHFEKA